jgi:hypothetical protein
MTCAASCVWPKAAAATPARWCWKVVYNPPTTAISVAKTPKSM